MSLTTAQAAQVIRASRGRFFGCTFITRTDGTVRRMWARFAVVAPVKAHRNREDLIVVWDLEKQAYRHIPVEGITELRIDGRVEEVVDRRTTMTQTTTNPGDAAQFRTKAKAVRAARAIRWPARSAEWIEGLWWALADDHLNYLTARGYNALAAELGAPQVRDERVVRVGITAADSTRRALFEIWRRQ